MDYIDYACVFHVHTVMSDGTGDIHDVIRAGHDAGVDVIIITDHHTLAYREQGFEGMHDGVLVLVGQEITPKMNHLVALGLNEVVETHDSKHDHESHIRRVASLGGLGIAVHPHHHPHYRRRFWKVIAVPWDDWDRPEIGGVELWSYMADWVHPVNLFNPVSMLYYIRHPEKAITGPSSSVIAEWDRITFRRRMPAIGGLDVHARRDPFHFLCVFPYEFMFRTIRTHVFAQPLTGNLQQDEKSVLDALREGRCYISYDILQPARGFNFTCRDEKGVEYQMGSELSFNQGLTLSAVLPASASICLIRNGNPVLEKECDSLEMPVDKSGVYRIEASLAGKPWIYSNPVYIREGNA